MASVFDVAYYILKKRGEITAMMLQKLVYYSQAWSMVWEDMPLFDDAIEAWSDGPVVPSLYNVHRGKYKIDMNVLAGLGNDRNLARLQRETIDVILDVYGRKDPDYLSELTHQERPWKDARRGLPTGARGNREITLEAMKAYYGSLYDV